MVLIINRFSQSCITGAATDLFTESANGAFNITLIDTSNHLLTFTTGGTKYSTWVNDKVLTIKSVAGNRQALVLKVALSRYVGKSYFDDVILIALQSVFKYAKCQK